MYSRPARPHCAQEGDNLTVFPFLRINPFPSGRAARARVSDAFQLPPGCHCDRQGIGCHLRTVRVPFTASVGARNARPHTGTRLERCLHGNGKYKPHIVSTPAPGVRRKTEPPRRYRKSNFSTECGQICLRSRAVVYIPGGGDSQEGAKCPLLCARRPRRPQIRRQVICTCYIRVSGTNANGPPSRRPLRDIGPRTER